MLKVETSSINLINNIWSNGHGTKKNKYDSQKNHHIIIIKSNFCHLIIHINRASVLRQRTRVWSVSNQCPCQ